MQACGDAHLSNFGLFGSPERKLVFDVNDFDETLPAPWEWDVKRLAASLEVAARENNFSAKDRKKIRLATVAGTGWRCGGSPAWATWTSGTRWWTSTSCRARFGGLLKENQRKALDKGAAKARTRDSMQELRKLTRIEDGQPRIIPDPPVIVPLRDLAGPEQVKGDIERSCAASSASTGDTAARPPGAVRAVRVRRHGPQGGRRGQRRDPVLDHPDARPGRSDPLFLQVKEAEESVLARFAGASRYATRASAWSTASG